MLRQVVPRWAVEVRVGLEDGECVRRWRRIHIMRVVLLDGLSTMKIYKEISVAVILWSFCLVLFVKDLVGYLLVRGRGRVVRQH